MVAPEMKRVARLALLAATEAIRPRRAVFQLARTIISLAHAEQHVG